MVPEFSSLEWRLIQAFQEDGGAQEQRPTVINNSINPWEHVESFSSIK